MTSDSLDCSHFRPDSSHDWDQEEVLQRRHAHCTMDQTLKSPLTPLCLFPQMLNSIRDCFVTGKWEEAQDAATLLKEDGERSKHRPQE